MRKLSVKQTLGSFQWMAEGQRDLGAPSLLRGILQPPSLYLSASLWMEPSSQSLDAKLLGILDAYQVSRSIRLGLQQ